MQMFECDKSNKRLSSCGDVAAKMLTTNSSSNSSASRSVVCRDKNVSGLATLLWVLFFFVSVFYASFPKGLSLVFLCAIVVMIFLIQPSFGSKGLFKIKLNSFWCFLVALVGISFMLNAILYIQISYFANAIIFCFVILFICLMCGCENLENVLYSMCKGFFIAFWLTVLGAFLFGPGYYAGVQYSAFIGNPNQFGLYLTSMVACTGFLLVRSIQNCTKNTIYIVTLFTVIIFSIMTGSRTTQLSILPQVVVIVFLSFRAIRSKAGNRGAGVVFRRFVKKFVLVGITACVLVFLLFTTVKYEFDAVLVDLGSSASISAVSPKTEQPDLLASMRSRYTKGLQNHNLNSFSSGRIGIWESFVPDIGIAGHATETKPVISGSRNYSAIYAHNVYIQVAYSAGIVSGVAMVLIMLVALKNMFEAIKIVSSSQISGFSCSFVALAACSILGFFVYSLIGDGYMIFKYMPATMFWICASALNWRLTIYKKKCKDKCNTSAV